MRWYNTSFDLVLFNILEPIVGIIDTHISHTLCFGSWFNTNCWKNLNTCHITYPLLLFKILEPTVGITHAHPLLLVMILEPISGIIDPLVRWCRSDLYLLGAPLAVTRIIKSVCFNPLSTKKISLENCVDYQGILAPHINLHKVIKLHADLTNVIQPLCVNSVIWLEANMNNK